MTDVEQTSANRTTLLDRKSQLALAGQGVSLLKAKRDALLQELMSMIDRIVEARADFARALYKASNSLSFAAALDGGEYLESLALSREHNREVIIEEKKLWGVRILEIEAVATPPRTESSGTTARAGETARDFDVVYDKLMKLAPLEVRVNRLTSEIRSTSRRVNALEQVLVPSLEQEIATISQALEELEREDSFRLRRAKTQREARATKGQTAESIGR